MRQSQTSRLTANATASTTFAKGSAAIGTMCHQFHLQHNERHWEEPAFAAVQGGDHEQPTRKEVRQEMRMLHHSSMVQAKVSKVIVETCVAGSWDDTVHGHAIDKSGTLEPGIGMGWVGGSGWRLLASGCTGSAGMPEDLEVGKLASWLPFGIESKLWKDLGSSWGSLPPEGMSATRLQLNLR